MILLTATTMTLQVVLDSAPVSSQATLYAAWADHTSTTFTPGQTNGLTNGTTAVDVVPAPAASTQRQLKYMSIYNGDTSQMTVTVRLNDNTTLRTLERVTLLTGERIEFVDGVGFRVLTSDGSVRTPNTLPYSVTQLKNQLINGNFDIWQRGTTVAATTGGFYLADRWSMNATGSTVAVSRQSFTLGQTDVPGEPTYYHRAVVASVAGASNLVLMRQRIEGVRTLAGQTATLSFYAKADAAKPMSIDFEQNFGVGGSPSAAVNGIGATKVNLTTSWQKFTVQVTLPNISGKTLGTNNDQLLVGFWFDAGSSFNSRTNSLGQQSGTFDIAQVQLETGSVATAFDKRIEGIELALCQRYYEKSYNLNANPGAITDVGISQVYANGLPAGTHLAGMSVGFAVRKRAVPALSLFSPVTGAAGVCRDFTSGADRSATATPYEGGFRWNSLAGAASSEYNYGIQWTADAEL